MRQAMLDRLLLTPERIEGMAEGLRQLAALEDPIGEVLGMKRRPNGLRIGQMRVPLGVIGIIYEARPNVTADAFGLCFKTGNAVILKGGSDAICSNKAVVDCIRETLRKGGVTEDAIQLIEDTSRETARAFMKMDRYVDVLIPRGGAGLIRSVVENSTIPVIETGTGNCHIYVDDSADIQMAIDIIFNAKTQRIGVCNACESTWWFTRRSKRNSCRSFPGVWRKSMWRCGRTARRFPWWREEFPPQRRTGERNIWTIFCRSKRLLPWMKPLPTLTATIQNTPSLLLPPVTSMPCGSWRKWTRRQCTSMPPPGLRMDFEFGFGAEIGISTQKLHARGPMGLQALTTTKYIIFGDGQIRP